MKKISYNDAAYILRYKDNHWFEKYCCNWYIKLNNPNEGYIRCEQKLWFYIVSFIPLNVIGFLFCLWDGGIKNYYIQPKVIHTFVSCGLTNDDETTQFGRLKEVWAR